MGKTSLIVAVFVAGVTWSTSVRGERLPFIYHTLEGPYNDVQDYCGRFASLDGTCTSLGFWPLPPPTGPLSGMTFQRVQSHKPVRRMDMVVVTFQTPKGLYVDELLTDPGDGAVKPSSVEARLRADGSVVTAIVLEGAQRKSVECLVYADGRIGCTLPGTLTR
jgi:hypothetical protein